MERLPQNGSYPDDQLMHFEGNWQRRGYYVAAVIDISRLNSTFTLGDKSNSTRDGVMYRNVLPVEDGRTYHVFVRVYSAAITPVSVCVCAHVCFCECECVCICVCECVSVCVC